MIKKLSTFIIVGIVLILFSGCTSTAKLESIPENNNDFNQPIETIRDNYTDIMLYEKKAVDWGKIFTFESPPSNPSVKELEKGLGRPDYKKTHWGEWLGSTSFNIALGAATGLWVVTAINQALFIFPAETLIWEKGTTKVEAKVMTSGFFGYESRLAYWEWSKVDSTLVVGKAAD